MEVGSEGSGVVTEVGTIVWVRRRNGSWWPGRILGQHELSASHLMSPRSGTPVKLLGREDASVDWYNLEKSKRVKAFRCGEFDACIEKAEAAQGIPIKKREKYARREDAIIHALELERQMLEKKLSKSGGGLSAKHPGALKKEPAVKFPSECNSLVDGSLVPGKLSKYKKVSLPVEPTNKGKSFSDRHMDDIFFTDEALNFDIAPRMRAMQDLGFHAISSKRKSTSGSDGSCKRLVMMDNVEDPELHIVRDMDGWYDAGNQKSYSSLKERSLSGSYDESKRKDKHLPFHQLLQTSSKFQAYPSLTCNGYSPDHMKVWPTHFGYDSHLEDESAYPDFIVGPYEPELPEPILSDPDMEQEESLILADAGVSRWNLKGKRNTRKLSKRAMNVESMRSIYNRGGSIVQGLHNHTDDLDESDFVEKHLQSELMLHGDRRYQTVFQGSSLHSVDYCMDDSDRDSGGPSFLSWDSEMLHHVHQQRQWDDLPRQFGLAYTGHFHDRMDSRLVDVNIEVQASYLGERVPLVSLMSKLNGKAIIGHPLQIETLSDGFTDTLLSDDFGDNPSHSYGTASPPVWRTGRRTSLPRIPRPQSSVMEDRSDSYPHAVPDSRITKRLLPAHHDEQTRLVKRDTRSHRPTKKSQKKSSKKGSLSNLKTRTLSSLAKGQKNVSVQNKSRKSSIKTTALSVLMDPGDAMPMVTCVPVKVVFSRIMEAVGRSPSHATVHRHLLTFAGSEDQKLL